MTEADAIVAIATGSGRAAIGVVRLSGPELDRFVRALLGHAISPRRAILTDFLDGHGHALDTGIALFFPGPHSYTGEDVLELQGHGGPAVLQLLLRRCLTLGARLAQPGEFSRRAFLHEKLDLAQAEAVADLIEASSEAAARAAMRSLKGEFSMQIRELLAELIALRAQVEACIDFPEEETHTPAECAVSLALQRLRDQVHEVQRRAASGRLLRDGAQVVLIGPPNVGKSSLFNRLAGEEAAIVTEFPGTTRDTVRSEFVLDGVPIRLVDTAGLREAEDLVERMGIDRTRKAVRDADVVLWVTDVAHQSDAEGNAMLAEIPASIKRIIVLNKIDLVGGRASLSRRDGEARIEVSAKTADGIDLLRTAILEATGRLLVNEGVFLARERHLEGLELAAGYLQSAVDCVSQQELFAEELRLAQVALGRITGQFSADDLLGEIFANFCIGK